MARQFSNIFVIIILCIAVIFISGILLPKYLSDQYFQLRRDLNSQKGASKYILKGNANTIVTQKSQNEKENSSHLSKNAEVIENLQSISNLSESHANSIQAPVKVKKRSKRQASFKEKGLFSWRLNLNITRHKDTPFIELSKNALNETNEDMGIALNVEGKGEKQTVSGDLHKTLESMDTFLSTLFNKNAENIDNDDKFINIHEGETAGIPVMQTKHTDVDDSTDVNEFNLKKREGKLIFGSFNIFGFGRKSLDKNTEFPEISSSSTEMDLSTPKTVEITSENVESTETVLSKGVQKFQVESTTAVKTPDTDFIAAVSNVPETTTDVTIGQNLCLDCFTESSLLSAFTNKADKSEEAPEIALASKPSFTDDTLEKFCMSLIKKVSESQHSSDHEDGHGFETGPDSINERNLISSLSKSPSDLTTELHSTNKFESDIIEDSFLVSNDKLPENELTRQSKFINFGSLFGLGSGRSAVFESDQFNVLSPENAEDPLDIKNLPSILDCETYFRTKHSTKMFPKPNLMDMISDPKIQLNDFDNGTMSGKLKEQNLMFLTDLLKNTFDNSVDTTGDSDKFRAKGFENVTVGNVNESDNPESIEMFTVAINKMEEEHGTDNGENELNVTDNQRDSRFINFFGFGSGNSEENQRSDERFFLGMFGSGLRSFDPLNSVIESDGNDLGSGDVFKKVADELTSDNLENLLETSNVLSPEERQFQGSMEFSGDGRQLAEDESTENFDKCDECFYEGNTTEFSDCDENDCNFNNHDQISKNDILENTRENYSFHETALKNITFDECDDCNFNPADLSNESNDSDGYSSEEKLEDTRLHENSENECDDCAHSVEFSIKDKFSSKINESFSECDDCSFNAADTAENIKEKSENMTFLECDTCNFNDSSAYDESYEAVDTRSVSKDSDQTNMREGSEDACDDCGHENDIKQPNKLNFNNTDGSLKELSTVKDTESTKNTINFRAGTVDDIDKSKMENATESSIHEIGTGKPGRFMGTIFLTGSGDGGLFQESGGPINLLEEESTIVVPDKPSRRGARLDDTLVDPFEVFTEKNEVQEHNSMETSRNPDEKTTIQAPIPRRRGRLDNSLEGGNNFKIMEKSQEQSNVNVITDGTNKGTFINEITDAPRVTSVPRFNINEISRASLPPKFCNSASECNVTLNEFCVTVESSRVCGCVRGYVRHKETAVCVVKRVIETSLKLPGEEFNNDLKDPSSARYQQMRNESIQVVWSIIQTSPDLMSVTTEIDVIRFYPGSVIVDYRLVFAVKNEKEAELLKEVEKDISIGLKDEKLLENISLDVKNAALISVNNAVNPCKSKDLNYCSPNAYCIWNEALPERFSCYCKDHYKDESDNPRNVGETCIAICPPEYCGPYGHCDNLQNGERYCLCTGMYFGRRCEVPGFYIAIVMAIVAFISITALFVVVFRKRCTAKSYDRTNADRPFRNGKVEEDIGLHSNVGMNWKYKRNSTPVPPPIIKVIHPSINEPSLSFEYDSTFDTTPESTSMRSSANAREASVTVATENLPAGSEVAETLAVEIPPDVPQSHDGQKRTLEKDISYII